MLNVAANDSMITTNEDLARFLEGFREDPPVCAVDTEADSLHSYREKLCLIQFTCEGEHRLINPLEINDMGPLLEFMERGEVWMHGADFDMSILKRTYGTIPSKVMDTQVAARLIGYERFGLAHLVEEMLGVKLSKQSQRANWGRRPLPEKMVTYALNDVRYIPSMRDLLEAKLRNLGRYDWFLQSCEGARQAVIDRPEKSQDLLWRVSGSGKLTRRGLAFLREFWLWRASEAERMDRPPFKIIGNEDLLRAATALSDGGGYELPQRFRGAARDRFHKGASNARALEESQWPKKTRGVRAAKDPGFNAAFQSLRDRRDKAATELSIDPTLIASKSILEKLALEARASEVTLLPWQQQLIYG
ncbi:MAG: ribonuclease D [Verrucomicrobiales bacterium]